MNELTISLPDTISSYQFIISESRFYKGITKRFFNLKAYLSVIKLLSTLTLFPKYVNTII